MSIALPMIKRSPGRRRHTIRATVTSCVLGRLAAALSCVLMASCSLPSWALTSEALEKEKGASGTLLIPITPKIDTSKPDDRKPAVAKAAAGRKSQAAAGSLSGEQSAGSAASGAGDTASSSQQASPGSSDADLQTLPVEISTERGELDEDSGKTDVDENTTLKGTIQIVADDTEYDQDKNTFLGTGNAVVVIAGENSKLEADTILYDQNSQIIDARGNVRIYRNGQLTTGSAFRFKVNSDEYLITKPDTEVQGATVIARQGFGSNQGMAFRNGTLQMPTPIHIMNNSMYGPLSSADEAFRKIAHPDAYLPSKPSFKFKARKMVYERYKESGNLTVFGGRVETGNFSLPLPKFTMTVGQENQQVIFPVTPLWTNNFQMGGQFFGPNFNIPEGKTGVFSVAPLLQVGGTSPLTGGASTRNGIGAGVRIGFTNDKISTHFAYGSVSNLVVADFKYLFNRHLKFQLGVNKFTEDGLFGLRRPRLISEVVDYHNYGGIPFIANLGFRTSAGWAQDNPSLLSLTPNYQKLFTVNPHQGNTTAFRIQEQITAISHPVFAIGNDKVGTKMYFTGGVAAKGYSTGDHLLLGQVGPVLDIRLNRFRFQSGYTQAAINGKSPFVFDQFIQGTRSVSVAGDLKISKFLTVGAATGYNLVNHLALTRTLTAAIGPEDCKLLLSRDTIRGINRYGFDVLFGQPIPFNKLVLKGNPDQGQLGGI